MTLHSLFILALVIGPLHHAASWLTHKLQEHFFPPAWPAAGTPCIRDLSKCSAKRAFLFTKGAVAINGLAFLWDFLALSLRVRIFLA